MFQILEIELHFMGIFIITGMGTSVSGIISCCLFSFKHKTEGQWPDACARKRCNPTIFFFNKASYRKVFLAFWKAVFMAHLSLELMVLIEIKNKFYTFVFTVLNDFMKN